MSAVYQRLLSIADRTGLPESLVADTPDTAEYSHSAEFALRPVADYVTVLPTMADVASAMGWYGGLAASSRPSLSAFSRSPHGVDLV